MTSDPPEAVDRRLVSAALGLIGGCALYIANHIFKLPVPLYLPEAGAWTSSQPDSVIAMRYYGGLIYLILGFLAGWVAGRLPPVAACLGRGRAAGLLAGTGAATLLLAMAYLAIAELSHWSH